MINIVEDWGISDDQDPDTASDNSTAFNSKIKSGQTLYLPGSSDPYLFDLMQFTNVDNVEFYGDSDTVIKFSGGHVHLEIVDADNFNIHDLNFDGRDANFEGGVWAKDGATNGTIKNVNVYDPSTQGITIGESDYESTPKTHNIMVEDCEVYGQRNWGGTTGAKAMILAGGGADDVTFENCTAYRAGLYNNTPDSPADLFDTDNATNVEYINCTAEGTDNENIRKGVGFWNEGEQEASSEYWNCTAKKTDGGLGATEKSIAIAHNFYFDDCSYTGWAAWSHGGTLEIYDSTFDNCYSEISSIPQRKGGFHIETKAVIKNCEFINTPDGYNVSLYTPSTNSDTITIENNTFDEGVWAGKASNATGTVNVKNNNFASDAELIDNQADNHYNWIISGNTWGLEPDSATTTAVNSPTSSTSVSVEYQSNFTSVQYNSGEAIDWMLAKMRDAINADSDAYITADINMSANTITFTQEDASYSDNQVSIYINSSDWGNGNPFNPMSPAMS